MEITIMMISLRNSIECGIRNISGSLFIFLTSNPKAELFYSRPANSKKKEKKRKKKKKKKDTSKESNLSLTTNDGYNCFNYEYPN